MAKSKEDLILTNTESFSDKEVLNFALENGIIDIEAIQGQIEMNKRKEYLEKHKSKIWQSTDGNWYTFLPDDTKESGKKLVKRKNKKDLEDCIIKLYKVYDVPQTIEKTFNEWIDRKIKFGEIKEQTVDRYRCDFNKYFAKCRKKNIRTVTEEYLEDLILDNIQEYSMSSKNWANMRTVLRGTFLYAKKKGYTNLSIVSFIEELNLSRKIFKKERKPISRVIFTEREVRQIVERLKNSPNLTDNAILFAIYTGMRVGEIVALKWEDIGENYIHIRRMQERFRDESGKSLYRIREDTKTEAGNRHVVIVPELRKVIHKLRAINPFTEYIFQNGLECMHKNTVSSRLYNLCLELKMPPKGMHSFRRYFATQLLNAGVEEAIIISQMGHTDINTTKQYYYRNNKEADYVAAVITRAISG